MVNRIENTTHDPFNTKKEDANMVRWTRSARIASGKGMQAMQWAKEITEWSNKKYNLQMTVYLDYFGEVGNVRWFVDYESLAALEKIRDQILGDQEYWQKVNQSTDLLVDGSAFDTVMRAI
jgi:hypothetical protein